MACQNLVDLVRASAERWPNEPAQRFWDGLGWQDRCYRELWATIQSVARGLRELGVRPGDRVGIVSSTRPEWVIADFAIWLLDAISVPVYPSVPVEQVAYIVEDAQIALAIVENEPLARKLPDTVAIITIEPDDPGGPLARSFWSLRVDEGDLVDPVNDRDDVATLVYTSGTTGLPKGVQLTHGNILANIEDVTEILSRAEVEISPHDVALSFLPLSHVLERMTHLFFLARGVAVAYARSTDQLPEDLLQVRPTLMVSVPRVFEKIYGRIHAEVRTYPEWRRRAFKMAVQLGERRYQYLAKNQPVPAWLAQSYRFFDRMVFTKIRAAVGGRLRLVISGGAPLAPELGLFFFGAGVPVLEGYGLTETAPVLTVNVPPVPRYGTVGKTLPRVEIRIAEDGEILARGPNVSPGYWNRPDETRVAMGGGWFHTGDVGRLTESGYLQVTDRKKSMLVLSTGKNVAPQLVEQKLLLSGLIDQAVVLGNRRKYVSALLYLDPTAVLRWAEERNKGETAYAALLDDPDLLQHVEAEVARVTETLAAFERPKRIQFIPTPLSQEAGDLTPSLKARLPVVEAKYRHFIDAMYEREPRGPQAADRPRQGGTHWMPATLMAIVAGVLVAFVIRYLFG